MTELEKMGAAAEAAERELACISSEIKDGRSMQFPLL
jgi:hypothetical protein